MPTYHVSGVIQVTVSAASAADAVRKAEQRARSLEKSPTIVVGLDNICRVDRDGAGQTVGLEDAADVDPITGE